MAASQPLSTYPISHGFLMAFSTSSQPQHTHILFVHLLFVSIVIQPLHRHQNHIKTSSKLLAFCLRSDCFQKIRTKILLVWMNRQVRYADFHLQKSSTLRGDIEKTGIAPGSFYCLWRLQGYVSCVISAFPLLIDHSTPGLFFGRISFLGFLLIAHPIPPKRALLTRASSYLCTIATATIQAL